MWPGLRPTFVPSGILIHSRLAATDMGRKVRGLLCPLLDRGAGSPSNTLSPGRRPRPTSLPSGILIYPAVWPQQTWAENWGLYPLGEGKLGPHLTQCGQSRGLYLHVRFHLDPFNRLAKIHQRHRQSGADRQTTVR